MKTTNKIVVLLLVLCTLSGCQDEPIEATPTEAPATQEVTTETYTLPNLSDIRSSEQPLLYDFLFGCLDWHVSINRQEIDSDLYLMRNVNLPGIIYTDWYPIQAGFTVPPLGSKIEIVELSEKQTDMYNSVVADLPDGFVLREGDWELVIYAGDAVRAFQNYNYSFRSKYKYTDTRVPPFLVQGSGWPTEWLRKEPYCSLMQEAGIDISDGWFDKFNYRGEYRLLQDDGTMTSEGFYAICTGIREFAFCDGAGSVQYGMTWENLMDTCNSLKCNLGELYHHGDWTPESKE